MYATNLQCPASALRDVPRFLPKCSRIVYRYAIIDSYQIRAMGNRGKGQYLRASLNRGFWRVWAYTLTPFARLLLVCLTDDVGFLEPRRSRWKSVGSKFARAGEPQTLTDPAALANAYDN